MTKIRRKHSMDLALLFCHFLAEKETQGISKKTIENYQGGFDRYIKEVSKPLSKESVDEWIQLLLQKDMNPISINHYLSSIRVFVNWLSQNDYIKPFLIKKMKCQEPQLKVFSDDEITTLLKRPKSMSNFVEHRAWAIISFIMGTGARASSVTNVKVCDLDFSSNEVQIGHLKNKKTAILPLSNTLVRVLKYYLSIWDIGDNYLFPDKFGGQLTIDALEKSLRNYCKRRQIKPRGIHSFRHTFAKKYIMSGGNALLLQRLLTHTDLAMTKKYVRLFSDDLHKDFENLCPLDSYQKQSTLIKRRDN